MSRWLCRQPSELVYTSLDDAQDRARAIGEPTRDYCGFRWRVTTRLRILKSAPGIEGRTVEARVRASASGTSRRGISALTCRSSMTTWRGGGRFSR